MAKKQVNIDLYKAGVVVDLSFGMWGATTSLNEEDLGLEGVPEDKILLGSKRLIKKDRKKKILNVYNEAKGLLYRNSFSFPFGNARFVPYARLNSLIEKMNVLEKAFFEARDDLIDELESNRVEIMKEYEVTFEKLLLQRNGLSDAERSDKKKVLLSQIRSKYPSREVLREKYKFEFVIFEIQSPEFNPMTGAQALDKVEEVKELEKIYREKVAKKLDIFLGDVVSTLKSRILDIVTRLSNRVENDNVKMSSINSFKRFAESFRELDFMDMDVDKAISGLEKKLADVEKKDLSDAAFKLALTEELDKVKEAANSVDISKVMGRFKRNLRPVEVA